MAVTAALLRAAQLLPWSSRIYLCPLCDGLALDYEAAATANEDPSTTASRASFIQASGQSSACPLSKSQAIESEQLRR